MWPPINAEADIGGQAQEFLPPLQKEHRHGFNTAPRSAAAVMVQRPRTVEECQDLPRAETAALRNFRPTTRQSSLALRDDDDQITGFQAIGTRRYFAPSFST
jgi:hypothetical protein